MKFLCLYKPGVEDDRPPSQEEMASMGKLIDDMTKAGVLLATEGCLSGRYGARVRLEKGAFTVTE